MNGHTSILEFFYQRGEDFKAVCKKGRTALHYACHQSEFEVAILLCRQFGANVDAKDSEGRTPIFLALAHPRWPFRTFELAAILINEFGANVDVCDRSGNTPVHAWLAADVPFIQSAHVGVVRLLRSNCKVRNKKEKLPIDLVDPSKHPRLYKWVKMATEDPERFLNETAHLQKVGPHSSKHKNASLSSDWELVLCGVSYYNSDSDSISLSSDSEKLDAPEMKE